jgi:RNA polymerase sigma-70 factor (ECF subfamily)
MASPFDVELAAITLERARRSDNTALATIYRQFEAAAYSLARRICGDDDDARDITHDAFLRAFGSLRRYRGDAPFGFWLRAIVANEALMHLRRGRRFVELFEEHVDEAAPDISNIAAVDLERALGLLTPLPRAVLWLYHVEGYTHAEIARVSGKTISFSKSQLSRAHQKLREIFCGQRVTAPAPIPAQQFVPISITGRLP